MNDKANALKHYSFHSGLIHVLGQKSKVQSDYLKTESPESNCCCPHWKYPEMHHGQAKNKLSFLSLWEVDISELEGFFQLCHIACCRPDYCSTYALKGNHERSTTGRSRSRRLVWVCVILDVEPALGNLCQKAPLTSNLIKKQKSAKQMEHNPVLSGTRQPFASLRRFIERDTNKAHPSP